MKKLLVTTLMLGAFAAPIAFAPSAHAGEKNADEWFAMADANKDGTITKAEFDAKNAEKFSKMDKDGNGSVTKEEAMEAKKDWKEKKAE